MGRSRPPYVPPSRFTRHVWVVTERGEEPLQGFVLAWRRHSYRWSAFVITVWTDNSGGLVLDQLWQPVVNLAPVRTSPTIPDAHDRF